MNTVDTNPETRNHILTKLNMSSSPTNVSNDDNEFKNFAISTDKILINPSTKIGKDLFHKLSDVTIKDDERLTGKASKAMKLHLLMQNIDLKGKFLGCLTFVDSSGIRQSKINQFLTSFVILNIVS